MVELIGDVQPKNDAPRMLHEQIAALILIVCILLLAVYKEINDWRVQRWHDKKGDPFATVNRTGQPRGATRCASERQ